MDNAKQQGREAPRARREGKARGGAAAAAAASPAKEDRAQTAAAASEGSAAAAPGIHPARRRDAESLACERFMELLAATESPVQLAALIRVIDKLPWPEHGLPSGAAQHAAVVFPELEALDLPGLLDEARRLISVIEEQAANGARLQAEPAGDSTGTATESDSAAPQGGKL